MSEENSADDNGVSRRRLLQATGGAIGLAGVTGLGSVRGAAAGARCPGASLEPEMVHYDDSLQAVCADGHPVTGALQRDVRQSLEDAYPTVGALLDAGFIPYFDFFADGTVSHWISPAFLGDDAMLDPDRPESVLVDHTWWRPIGVMFVATENGERVNPPPTVYEREDGDACMPWHAHVGLPGRYAWWKYETVYDDDGAAFPCRTPWMMHVWIYPHSKSTYAHGPPEERGGPPAEPPGFETDADPDEEVLGPEHLPDAVLDEVRDLWGRR